MSPCGDGEVRGDENFAKNASVNGFGWLGLGFRGGGRGPRSGGALDGREFRCGSERSGAVVHGSARRRSSEQVWIEKKEKES
jgi:hypothetical protein